MSPPSLRRQIKRNLFTGAAVCAAGLVITLLTLVHSVDGRPFVIAWGAVGLGLLQAIVAALQLRRLR